MSRQLPHVHRRKLFRRRLKRAMQESLRRNTARIDANLAKLQADPSATGIVKLQGKGMTFFEKTKTHERLCLGRSAQKTNAERSEDLRRVFGSSVLRSWYRREMHRRHASTEADLAWNRRRAAHSVVNMRYWIYTGRMPDLYTDLTHRRMLKPKKRSKREKARSQQVWDEMRRAAVVPAYSDTPPYIRAEPASISEPVAVVIESGNIRNLE